MKLIKNLKDPITDIIGLVVIVLTLWERYNGEVEWIWEGMAGMGVGATLFLMPDQWIMDLVNKVRDKLLSK